MTLFVITFSIKFYSENCWTKSSQAHFGKFSPIMTCPKYKNRDVTLKVVKAFDLIQQHNQGPKTQGYKNNNVQVRLYSRAKLKVDSCHKLTMQHVADSALQTSLHTYTPLSYIKTPGHWMLQCHMSLAPCPLQLAKALVNVFVFFGTPPP